MMRQVWPAGRGRTRSRKVAGGALVGILAGVAVLAGLAGPSVSAAADRFSKSKSCLDCHDETKRELKTKHAHRPFKDEDCRACHKPHGILGALNLTAEGADLCLGCH